MHEIILYITNIVSGLGYTGIFIMMVLESSFFPFPSEVAMIPAGFLASKWEMNIYIAFFTGTIGALVGASINYFLWYYLGEPIIKSLIKKYGKYFFITESHYTQSQVFFEKHGIITTFLARFITIIRQLISLPAWVFKMNFAQFLFFTWLWAGLWNIILMFIGYIAGENEQLIAQYTKELLIWGILFVCITAYLYFHKNKRINK